MKQWLEKNAEGKLAITRVVLRQRRSSPAISNRRRKNSRDDHMAHDQCFIANSVKTDHVEGQLTLSHN
jgi:hypothetical protein